MLQDNERAMPAKRFAIAMMACAAIGLVALISAGVFGALKLIRYRRQGVPPAVQATAGLLDQDALLPSPAPAPEPIPPKPKVKTYERTGPPAALPGGIADLAVRIVDTGIATGGGAGFIHSNAVQAGERPAIVFTVINAGTAVSERWQFTANLPAVDGRFTSELQQPLAPGEGRRFTIGFSELNRQGENQATITVFPWKGSGDANFANDAATAVLTRGY